MFPVPIGKSAPDKPRAVTGKAGEPLQGVDGISGVIW